VIGTTDPVATHAIRVVSVKEYTVSNASDCEGPLYRHTSSARGRTNQFSEAAGPGCRKVRAELNLAYPGVG
jgi:hypothetical protein